MTLAGVLVAGLAGLLAQLPVPAGPLAPSFLRTTADAPLTGLANVDGCASCHGEVEAMWSASAHAAASFSNPIYRAGVDVLRTARGDRATRFCGGCHDLALITEGAMDTLPRPEDPRAHTGVTCRACHSIQAVTVDGNGSIALDPSPIPIPVDGDPASIARHKARVAPPALRDAAFCTGCHRAFLDAGSGNTSFLIGQDDATPWARSVYAGSTLDQVDDEAIAEQRCQDCHMPDEAITGTDPAAKDGKLRSHRALGAHTWLAAMRNDPATAARVRAFLTGAASIDIARAITPRGTTLLPEGADLRAGEPVTVDVVVRNRRAGHRFPGGVADAQDVWIEVAVTDARGTLVASSGLAHRATGRDPSVHRLKVEQVGADARPRRARETHEFRAVAWNHTLAPRDAAVVPYALAIPADAVAPFAITARLLHRTRGIETQDLACAATKTPRGRAFAAASRARGVAVLDACAPQPITVIDERTIVAGAGWEIAQRAADVAHPPRARWQRLYDHGLAWTHAVQERIATARPSLEAALVADAGATPRGRAAVLALLAKIAAREGRPDDTFALAAQAELLLPGHPALAALRGEALALTWRWVAAIPHLVRAAAAAPRDDRAQTALATALASANRPAEALAAARRGLALTPRDHDLLRVQALSLRALGAPAALVEEATQAWLAVRPTDDVPGLRGRCQKLDPGCARERVPVHTH